MRAQISNDSRLAHNTGLEASPGEQNLISMRTSVIHSSVQQASAFLHSTLKPMCYLVCILHAEAGTFGWLGTEHYVMYGA